MVVCARSSIFHPPPTNGCLHHASLLQSEKEIFWFCNVEFLSLSRLKMHLVNTSPSWVRGIQISEKYTSCQIFPVEFVSPTVVNKSISFNSCKCVQRPDRDYMWVHDLFIQHILAKGSHILFPRAMIAISQDILPFLSGGWNVISITNETGREMVGEQYQDRTFTEVCGGVARDSRVGLRDSGRLVYSGRIGTLAHLHRVGVRVTSGSVGALGDPCTLTPLPPSCFIPFQYHSELTPPKCSWVQAWDSPYIIQIKH